MQNREWQKTIEAAADPQRAGQYLEQLKNSSAGPFLKRASAEQGRVLAAIFSGSVALSETLMVHPEWLEPSLDVEGLANPRQEQGLRREVAGWLKSVKNPSDNREALEKLRQFKQKEMLRIAARDLAHLTQLPDIILELSNVADVCLSTVALLVYSQIEARIGTPWHQREDGEPWERTSFATLGMGKLGGQELNYSSDVDLLFVYEAEGFVFKTPPRKGEVAGRGLASHQFFKQLAEGMIQELTRMTPEGALYRIDMRLRPEGKNGPLARSLESYENYYAQWGQSWERMMLIKARGVAGDRELAAEFIEMVQPFRYPRSLGEEMVHEVGLMKQRIEKEVIKAGEIDRNVKLGRGGIREIEFIAQTQQILHAGRSPFLQGVQTLAVLKKLVDYELLQKDDEHALRAAYFFLRDVEHRLQMENNRQTHTIPTDRKARERLAGLMEFPSLKDFETALHDHTTGVREVYDKFIKINPRKPAHNLPADFDGAEDEWIEILRKHSFLDPAQGLRLAKTFVQGPGYGHTSSRTAEAGLQLLGRFLDLCRRTDQPAKELFLSDPDRVLARLDAFVSVYGARSLLFETWRSNPSLFRVLLLLFDRSEFLAELAIRTPDLVDTLELSGQLRRGKTPEIILDGLRAGKADEDQLQWIRRYQQAELMRIGLRDILEFAGTMQTEAELTSLAEACLRYALETVLARHKVKKCPLAIIGLGKLGGGELIYGSDLDIIFLANDSARDTPALQKLALEVIEALSLNTENGVAFATDTRLRPDGLKGLIVNTLAAHEDYYRKRALLWEIQSLTRARFIAGDEKLGSSFEVLAGKLSDFSHPAVQCYTPDWKAEIGKMRMRIEKERTPPGKQELAIKTGTGALVDAEFIAQTLCLEHGWREPNTVKAIERAVLEKMMQVTDGKQLMNNYSDLLRVEFILRRWSFAPESVLPDTPEPLYRVAVRCGFTNADAFLKAIAAYRTAIRETFFKVFPRCQ